MTDAPELRPCPFCGNAPMHNSGGNSVYGRPWWAVWCNNCQVEMRDLDVWDKTRHGYLDLLYPPKECLTWWNRCADLCAGARSKPDQMLPPTLAEAMLVPEVAARVKALETCRDELDEYSRQEYPVDHPVHERYRRRDYYNNTARLALAELEQKS